MRMAKANPKYFITRICLERLLMLSVAMPYLIKLWSSMNPCSRYWTIRILHTLVIWLSVIEREV
jgi:hypothetical protein